MHGGMSFSGKRGTEPYANETDKFSIKLVLAKTQRERQ